MLLLFLVGATAGAPPTGGHPGREPQRRPQRPVLVAEPDRLEEDDEEVILFLMAAQATDDWS